MTQRQDQLPQDVVLQGRGPVAPPFAFPVIDRLLGMRRSTVLDVRAETPTILSVRLERPRGFNYRAGQHAMLRVVTDQGPDFRPLSLASAPQAPWLEFATRIGPSAFKQAFLALRPGHQVKVSRPMGSFGFDPSRPAVMVTGGIGITPVKSMLAAAVSSGHGAPIRLLCSNRAVEEIPFRPEFEEFARAHPDLRITWALQGPTVGAPSGEVVNGRIDLAQLAQQKQELPDAMFYVTGPAAMVQDMREMLRSIGLANSRIRQSRQTFPLTR
jgi:ferredoxin-NADP reductase